MIYLPGGDTLYLMRILSDINSLAKLCEYYRFFDSCPAYAAALVFNPAKRKPFREGLGGRTRRLDSDYQRRHSELLGI
jgi:hypothetical protein